MNPEPITTLEIIRVIYTVGSILTALGVFRGMWIKKEGVSLADLLLSCMFWPVVWAIALGRAINEIRGGR